MSGIEAGLRINMTSQTLQADVQARRYQGAIELVEYADQQGFTRVTVEEHHCAENGWLPSPLIMAGMLLARTQTLHVSVSALLATLYEPVRLAEDIAVLDLASGGRISLILGMGYRPLEYHATGSDWANRGAKMDEVVETLLKAWSGEAFEFRGQTIRVTPTPLTKPHPMLLLGGMSKPAVRRAARFGLPFCPPMYRPDLAALYDDELKKHGKQGFVYQSETPQAMLFIAEDPEQAWEAFGEQIVSEAREYSSWKAEGVKRPLEGDIKTVDDLREDGSYQILSPAQCLAQWEDNNKSASFILHPLAGGIPVDAARASVELFVQQVLNKAV